MKALLHLYFPELEDDDIKVTSSGATGEDLQLSPKARSLFNFTTEIKNQEKINIWDAIRQAKEHRLDRPSSWPLVVFKRNNSSLMACLDLHTLISLVAKREPGSSNS
jgi:hypothetical protein